MKRIRIPKGYKRLRNGTVKRCGDKFLSQDGRWVATSDYGTEVTPYYPINYNFPKWTGVYVRRIS